MKKLIIAGAVVAGLAGVVSLTSVAMAQQGMMGQQQGMGRGEMGRGGMRGQQQDPAMTLTQRFERLDSNKDGFLDASELAAMRAQMIERFDANKDGADNMMARLDKNTDGRITREELAVDATPVLKLLDRDNDGKVSKAELQTLIDAMQLLRPQAEGGRKGQGRE